MSIKDNLLKIKYKNPLIGKTAVFALIFGLVFIFSFQLGRLTTLRDARTPIVLGSFETTVLASAEPSKTTSETTPESKKEQKISAGAVVASKQGKTYHLPSCPGAKNIAPENKITFTSRAIAQKAGYSPAKNCKGLSADSNK